MLCLSLSLKLRISLFYPGHKTIKHLTWHCLIMGRGQLYNRLPSCFLWSHLFILWILFQTVDLWCRDDPSVSDTRQIAGLVFWLELFNSELQVCACACVHFHQVLAHTFMCLCLSTGTYKCHIYLYVCKCECVNMWDTEKWCALPRLFVHKHICSYCYLWSSLT